MSYAVYHNDTLGLLGVLNEKAYSDVWRFPMRDGVPFELPALEPVPAVPYAAGSETVPISLRIAFHPLILKNKNAATFALFVECHPQELLRVRGFKPV